MPKFALPTTNHPSLPPSLLLLSVSIVAPQVMNPSIYVKGSTRFESMVLTLAATKIHQLYFVDEAL